MNTNRVLFHGNPTGSFQACFGGVIAAIPMHHVKGLGHQESIRVSFLGGLAIELTRAAAIDLVSKLPDAIKALPAELNGADVSGSVARITGDE